MTAKSKTVLQNSVYESPIGPLEIIIRDQALCSIHFLNESTDDTNYVPLNSNIRKQLDEYFDHQSTTFDLPLSPEGTPFQLKVWKELQNVPYGTTITYGELSEQIGDTKAVRAVGRANGQNPIPIIIPCHRVIGQNQKLTGYAGGIERKKWLLRHEGALLL